jgi:translation elongation factor EF-G
MVNTEAVIRYALQESLPITLVVNKIDRLILELRLPPTDAFYKIKHTIEDINTYIRLVYYTHFKASGAEPFVIVASTQVRISV